MLKDQLNEDMKDAMRAHDELRLSTIRMLKSAIQYYEIQKGGAGYEATDEDVLDVIGKEVKKHRESIEMFKQGGNAESAEKEEKELEILQKYLPEQMGEDEVRTLVKDAVTKSGATSVQDMGKVMGILMPQVKGKADGTMVSSIVKEELSS